MSEPSQLQQNIGRLDESGGQAAPAPAKSPAQEDYDKGKQFQEAGDLGQAAASFHNALIGFEQAGDQKGIANAVCQLGEICCARQKFEQALSYYQRAYEICDAQSDRFSLLLLKKKMAEAHRDAGHLDQAISLYLEVLDIYGDHNNPQGAVDVLQELAELYLARGERASAAEAYRTAASIHANFRHKRQAVELREKAEAVGAGG